MCITVPALLYYSSNRSCRHASLGSISGENEPHLCNVLKEEKTVVLSDAYLN